MHVNATHVRVHVCVIVCGHCSLNASVPTQTLDPRSISAATPPPTQLAPPPPYFSCGVLAPGSGSGCVYAGAINHLWPLRARAVVVSPQTSNCRFIVWSTSRLSVGTRRGVVACMTSDLSCLLTVVAYVSCTHTNVWDRCLNIARIRLSNKDAERTDTGARPL